MTALFFKHFNKVSVRVADEGVGKLVSAFKLHVKTLIGTKKGQKNKLRLKNLNLKEFYN